MVPSIKNLKKAKRKSKSSKKGDGSSSSSSIPSMPVKVWQPGVDTLEEGEELQCDPSAYNSLHAFHIGWPCLSFDVVRDSLGLVRTEFPHTVYCVTGTQKAIDTNAWEKCCKIMGAECPREGIIIIAGPEINHPTSYVNDKKEREVKFSVLVPQWA